MFSPPVIMDNKGRLVWINFLQHDTGKKTETMTSMKTLFKDMVVEE